MVDIEMFLPIRQSILDDESALSFHSYFEVAPLLGGVVDGDVENCTEQVYAWLLDALDANGLKINSPFFHVLYKAATRHASVYVGYSKPST